MTDEGEKTSTTTSTICIQDRHVSSGLTFGGRQVEFIRVASGKDSSTDRTFLKFLAGNRITIKDVPLNTTQQKEPLQIKFEENGYKYEVISSKINEDEKAVGKFQGNAKKMRLYYLLVDGPDLTPINPKEWLESMGDFESLSTRKAVSRLELFQSPAACLLSEAMAKKCDDPIGERFVKTYDANVFVDVEERGHTGCGFICENLLKDLLRGAAKVNPDRALDIQVRNFVPSKGIYKGMLMRKKMPPEHEGKILLPTSMNKVKAARKFKDSDKADVGHLIVNNAGIDPSKNNTYLAKLIEINHSNDNGSDTSSPKCGALPKSFIPEKLKDAMILLFQSLGIPERIVLNYVQNATRRKGEERIPKCNHTYLRGVADPTDKIPPNHVFITGFQNVKIGESIFITRSPCIKSTAGCRVKIVTEKLENMTDEEYQWLNDLPFGVVIFGFPSKGMKPLPERIANGDLDGDRYFVLWDKVMLEHMDVSVMVDEEPLLEEENEGKQISVPLKQDDEWFIKVQKAMVDLNVVNVWNLVGKLHSGCIKYAMEDKERILRNPNAEAFADAYLHAIDNMKHGTTVALPLHLWKSIPSSFHKYLQTMNGIKFGRLVEKKFPEIGIFIGEVREYVYVKDTYESWLKVVYTDGDMEELTIEELTRLKEYRGPRPTIWEASKPLQRKKSLSSITKRTQNGNRKQSTKRPHKRVSKSYPKKKKRKRRKATRLEIDLNWAAEMSLLDLQPPSTTSTLESNHEGGNKSPQSSDQDINIQEKRPNIAVRKSLQMTQQQSMKKHHFSRKRMTTRFHGDLDSAIFMNKTYLEPESSASESSGEDYEEYLQNPYQTPQDTKSVGVQSSRNKHKLLHYSNDDSLSTFAGKRRNRQGFTSNKPFSRKQVNRKTDHLLIRQRRRNLESKSQKTKPKMKKLTKFERDLNRAALNSLMDLELASTAPQSITMDEGEGSCSNVQGDCVKVSGVRHDLAPISGACIALNTVSSDDDEPDTVPFEKETESCTKQRVELVDHASSKSCQPLGVISITYEIDDYGETVPTETVQYGGTSSLSCCDKIIAELELRDPNLPCAGASLERVYQIYAPDGDVMEYSGDMLSKRSISDLLDITGTKPENPLKIKVKYREVLPPQYNIFIN